MEGKTPTRETHEAMFNLIHKIFEGYIKPIIVLSISGIIVNWTTPLFGNFGTTLSPLLDIAVPILVFLSLVGAWVVVDSASKEKEELNRRLKKRDKAIKEQKKRLRELKAPKVTIETEAKDENTSEEKLPHSQEDVVGCLDRLIDSDPHSRTKADGILEYDCLEKLENAGIPIYLLQDLYELKECKKLITQYGLEKGLKIINEEGPDLAGI